MLNPTDATAEPVIELDEDTHVYTVDGVVRPSVSEIIEPYSGLDVVDWQLLRARAELGRQVHEACDLFDRGELERCDDELWRRYVHPWARFVAASGAVIVASEVRCYHPEARYAGTIDRMVLFPDLTLPSVLDIKTSAAVPRTVGMQTGAYQDARRARGQQAGRNRYCLHLPGDGQYRLHKLTGGADLDHFRAALTMWRFMNRRDP